MPLVETRLAPILEGGPAELQVRGPMLFSGYRTAEGLVGAPASGWYATGDLAEIHDGQLRLLGRAKDVIIRSGHNIDPAMIEDLVVQYPGIQMAAAVGMPDAFAGELPVVFAVAAPGASLNLPELSEFVASRIEEPPARPKRIILVETLPLTAAGKVARYKLRQKATVMRVIELLAAIDMPVDVTCEDVAARMVQISWHGPLCADTASKAAALIAPLGVSVVEC
jgi:fatty-acyl-CoA synthase